jgi:CRP-like cAMP-binding protein
LFTDRFLRNRRGAKLTYAERDALEGAISEILTIEPRTILVHANEPVSRSILLIEGYMCRYIDDHNGARQLVAVHVPGDFVDLHAYPLKMLEHDVAALTAVTVATVPHRAIDALIASSPELARKLWFSTLVDAAMHRAWVFRLGRLSAIGRVAHFLSELNARLEAVGLSDGRRFAFGVTQVDLAEACGLTNVHVNRVIRQLREEGLCTFRSALVEILDRDGLARRGQFDPDYLYLEPEGEPL